MIILTGLGNPGEKYSHHRHNVGFMAVDAIADAHGFGPARQKFDAEFREGVLEGPSGHEKALILKPQTYMNDSGRAVQKAMQFYKLAQSDVIVFYDELDLVPGKLKVKTGGGAAGHNGIRSIDSHIGNNFRRVRIGIGHPGDKSRVSNYVLGNFAKVDQEWLTPMLEAIAHSAPFLTAQDDNRFATAVAQRIAPARSNPNTPKKKPDEKSEVKKPEAKNEPSSTNPFSDAFQKILGRKD